MVRDAHTYLEWTPPSRLAYRRLLALCPVKGQGIRLVTVDFVFSYFVLMPSEREKKKHKTEEGIRKVSARACIAGDAQ